jgi:Domain of unknown function (DUF1902)
LDFCAADWYLEAADWRKGTALTQAFHVAAVWDDEAKVFVSQSDIPGLVIEAESFDEFVALVDQLAPSMIADNLPQARGDFTVHVSALRDIQLTAA